MGLETRVHEHSFIPRSELPRINQEIAQGDTWKRLWHWLRLPDPSLAKSTRSDDWWAISPLRPSEETPSFHMNAKGWSCFSTGQNGSFLNLAAEMLGKNIYHAAHDVREALLVGPGNIEAPAIDRTQQVVQKRTSDAVSGPANSPIRADLTKSKFFSARDARFDHRDIPLSIFEELGAGYLDRPIRNDGRPDHLNQRHVFQIRGVEQQDGDYRPVILSHMGRASLEGQTPKWWIFPGFQARFELYNIDLALLDESARRQAEETGHVVIVEGAFDVARLYAAGIRNVVATYGKQLYEEQIPRFRLLSERLGVDRFLIFYDRGQDGCSETPQGRREDGALKAVDRLNAGGLEAEIFRWDRTFSNGVRQDVPIPPDFTDPCEFSVEALSWFRSEGIL